MHLHGAAFANVCERPLQHPRRCRAWLCHVLPITTDDGELAFMVYEGGYLKALWHWLYKGPA